MLKIQNYLLILHCFEHKQVINHVLYYNVTDCSIIIRLGDIINFTSE